MNKKSYIVVLFLMIAFACKKEDRILNKLKGTWTVSEYNRKSTGVVNSFPSSKNTFEFIYSKNAYTSSLKGVYKVDYFDANIADVIDTFKYELKKEELSITKVQKSVNVSFLRQRFKLDEYKNNNLTLTRIDTSDYYIKATK
jgi:hypothetical protein